MLRWRKQDITPEEIDLEQEQSNIKSMATPVYKEQLSVGLNDFYVRPAIILTAFIIFCGLIYSAGQVLWRTLDQPITQIRVSGNTEYLDKEVLMGNLVSSVSQSVLSLDISKLQAVAQEEPWVNSSRVMRQWPPAIKVSIDEQIAVAKWGGKGLLNHQGDIFWPDSRPELTALPLLNGPSTDTARVMDQYRTFSQFFNSTGTGNNISGLTLQPRGAWTLLLSNEIEVELGRENTLSRLRRFLQLYQGHLFKKADQIERVDVRYTNGVAVKWKKQIVEDALKVNIGE